MGLFALVGGGGGGGMDEKNVSVICPPPLPHLLSEDRCKTQSTTLSQIKAKFRSMERSVDGMKLRMEKYLGDFIT